MQIAVAGTSKIKVNATIEAVEVLGWSAQVVPVKGAEGFVDEQPVGEKAGMVGSSNRSDSAYKINAECDLYVGIESYIELVDGKWTDYAMIRILQPSTDRVAYQKSNGCIFPTDAVEATRISEGGFKQTTVGEVLKLWGVINDNADPHIDLCGKHRQEFLTDALVIALRRFG